MNTKIITSSEVWMEGLAINQFNKAAELEGVVNAVAFPDLHPGKGIPVGVAFITRNKIYPHLIGNDIGCGIVLWQTDIKIHKIKLDKWVKKLENFSDCDCNCEEILAQHGLPGDLYVDAIGTIGSGNHFAEIQQIETVVNAELFEALKLDRKLALIMVHCGSRGFGNYILRKHVDAYGAMGLDPDTGAGHDYITEHDKACSWALANRQAVAEKLMLLTGANSTPVNDAMHNMIEPLNDGQWIHRKGAVKATDKPVVIAGTRGDLSYLVIPVASGESNAFSLAHGAGRKWKRNEAKGRMSHKYRPDSLVQTGLGSRVICHDRELLYEEAPQAYKRIETVIKALANAGLIDVIATLKPLITLKKGKDKL